MTLTDFENLNQIERYDVTMDYAEFLCSHNILNKRYLLYTLGTFYIEQEWDYPNKRIQGIKAFNSESESLDKYNNLILRL